jgi:dihydrofolate synthase / folylpolyglutamate synthase
VSSIKNKIKTILDSLEINKIKYEIETIKKIATEASLCNFPSYKISIAGTNGKGSIVKIIETICKNNKLKVASYTSPHILSFNERIKINGKNISDVDLLFHLKEIISLPDAFKLSYFETTTLVALSYFKRKKCDIALFEAGLGGRLDATNIIPSDMLIINTISLDHCEYLGDSIIQIAVEKAGLVKENQQVVLGVKNPPTQMLNVILAKTKNINLINKDFKVQKNKNEVCFNNNNGIEYNFKVSPVLLSSHQLDNLGSACQAISLLPFKIDDLNLQSYQNIAHMQKIKYRNKNFLLDVAHNEEAAEALKNDLLRVNKKYKAIFSCLDDKKIKDIIKATKDIIDEFLIFPLPTVKAMSVYKIKNELDNQQIKYKTFANIKEIMSHLEKNNDTIIVFGSFYTITEILNYIRDDRE